MTNNDTTAALRQCEDLPETIYCWRHGDDEPINGMWLECNDSANPGVKYVRERAEREAFAHRYNTVVYEIWNDGWKQGYQQGQQSAAITQLEQATPQPEAIDTNTAVCNHSPQQHIQTPLFKQPL